MLRAAVFSCFVATKVILVGCLGSASPGEDPGGNPWPDAGISETGIELPLLYCFHPCDFLSLRFNAEIGTGACFLPCRFSFFVFFFCFFYAQLDMRVPAPLMHGYADLRRYWVIEPEPLLPPLVLIRYQQEDQVLSFALVRNQQIMFEFGLHKHYLHPC